MGTPHHLAAHTGRNLARTVIDPIQPMALTFTLRHTTSLPLEVETITPERCRALSLSEIERLTIQHGNERIPLAEFFTIEGSAADERHCWQGRLTSVHWLGTKMTRGQIRVEGPIGRHLGSGMFGGEIYVSSSAGDWCGAEMHGGSISVAGDVADCAGAAYRGSVRGMTGGKLLVRGNCRHELGRAMRRGMIAIGGCAGDFVGSYMRAGTILVFGKAGFRHGAEMRRGTIGLFSHDRSAVLPSFRYACRYQPTALTLALRHLRHLGFPLPISADSLQVDLYHGDLLAGGRGELMMRA